MTSPKKARASAARASSAPSWGDAEITTALRWVIIGALAVGLALALGSVVSSVSGPVGIDRWWNDTVDHVVPALRPWAFVLNFVGGGWFATFVVPLGGAALLFLVRKRWTALVFIVASAVSAGLVQLLKHLFSRARPGEMLVVSDHGSFPSGHTANAATIAVLLLIFFPRVWVFLVGAAWAGLMALSRTQVHAHWFTDTVGGTLVGIGAALIVCACFAAPLLRDRRAHLAAG